MSARHAHLWLPLLYTTALFALSSVPGQASPDDPSVYALFAWLPPTVQNLLHVPAFGALAALWWWALGAWTDARTRRAWLAATLAAGYGCLDEAYQALVPGRVSSATDLTLNLAGVTAVIMVVALRRNGGRERSKPLPN